MAYASVSDLIQRFGERELINNTTPEGMPGESIDQARVSQALTDASALIDSFLNRRFAVPLQDAPASVVNACCKIARFDLAQSGASQPTEQMRLDQKDALAWLTLIAKGTVTLDGQTAANESSSWSRIQKRRPMQGGGALW
ncbi:DUF1320 domain-containing protein [Gluconobacter sp. LMG 31484]|uniref:DUF1320 domain-containing protein n=1 Tax=Gluconobacter vitians TaxID=2728102 RepID=A0ABR9Y4D0_9PROT|nr:DUF1320 domain-containing protein [Gluconobacter vitians]MBF0858801.1 DUF1320 domain-containing protein [Gluconobacter vitians]